MTHLKQLLATTHLLTLTGVGGTGKTRLALQVADPKGFQNPSGLAFPDGVWFIELAPLADPALVPQTVATVLGVREEPGRPIMATLLDWLRAKQLLLLLDNCEHLIDACAQFADSVLHACPHVKILATSREALGITGERTFQVPSLEIPNPNSQIPTTELAQLESVQLFVDRAQAVQATFQLTDANTAAVAQICQRLDGIPLAIELAAARVKAMRVEQVAERLHSRFLLLTGGSRTALRRQQTLRAAIDWSHNLLSEPERVLLRRLSVFAGGWTLEAAEAVCSSQSSVVGSQQIHLPTDDWLLPTGILEMLTHLVDKSLVLLDEESVAPRYRMLETIREYALEKLAESGESEAVRSRHLAYFLAFTPTVAPSSMTVVQLDKWQRLVREVDNLRAALGWAMNTPDPAAALRLSVRVYVLWHVYSHLAEGRQWLEQALALNPQLETDTTAPAEERTWYGRALRLAAHFMFMQGDMPNARAFTERSLSLLRQTGHKSFLASTLVAQALAVGRQGDLATARVLLDESVGLARESGDVAQIYVSLMALGSLDYHTGNYPAGQAIFADLLARAREGGYDLLISNASYMLGEAARVQGDYARARQWLEEGLAIRDKLDNPIGTDNIFVALGRVAATEGHYREARLHLTEALVLARKSETTFPLAHCLLGFAALARVVGQGQNAARWLSTVNTRHSFVYRVITPDDRPEFEREREALRTQLGDEAFNVAWEAGSKLTLRQALAEAELLQVPERPEGFAKPFGSVGGLTAREREVAALVGQGLSNREIAEKLVLGERTIETHVSNIFNKLGFTARSQVRQWAKEKGLQ